MSTDSPFLSYGLDPRLCEAVADLGWGDPTPIQARAIPSLLGGRDVVGRARTGSGKTAAFGLPALQTALGSPRKTVVLVLAPTRELALQVSEAMVSFARGVQVRIATIYGGSPYKPQFDALAGRPEIVVGTPGRIIDHLERGSLDLSAIQLLVLDEADEMLRMGFVEDVERIVAASPAGRRVALFSATMPDPIRRIAETYLVNPEEIAVEERALTVDHVPQEVVVVPQRSKLDALARILATEEGSVLVFARTRQGCAEVAEELAARGLSADALHGDLGQQTREHVLGRLRSGRLRVLVATDVAARGLDVEHLALVVNLDLPTDIESYVHRIGRTGRAGRAGRAITLATPKERDRIRRLEQVLKVRLVPRPVPSDADLERRRRADLATFLGGVAPGEGGAGRFAEEVKAQLSLDDRQLLERALTALASMRQLDLEAKPDEAPPKWTRRAEATPTNDEAQIFLPLGKRNGVRPQDVVGALANDRGISGSDVGKIFISDRKTLVGLPSAVVDRLVGQMVELRGHQVPITRVRPELVRAAPDERGPRRDDDRGGPPRRGPPRRSGPR